MARIVTESGQEVHFMTEIQKFLKERGIELAHWSLPNDPKVHSLLEKPSLNDVEKEELLKLLDERFFEQKEKYGYQMRDLIVLHPETPGLNDMLGMFDRCHTHADDEVRYIVDGTGIFGFIPEGHEQFKLYLESEEYIRVPAGTEHWFILDEARRIKAVRYFTSKEGWTPEYTSTQQKI